MQGVARLGQAVWEPIKKEPEQYGCTKFQYWLVVWNIFFHVLRIIIQTDFQSRAEHAINGTLRPGWRPLESHCLALSRRPLPKKHGNVTYVTKPSHPPVLWPCTHFGSTAIQEEGPVLCGDTCPVCCQCFHSRNRLSIHLERNDKCYAIVQACWPPLPKAVVMQMDADDSEQESQRGRSGWWASTAFSPVLQTHGPSLPPLRHAGCHDMYERTRLTKTSICSKDARSRVIHTPAPMFGGIAVTYRPLSYSLHKSRMLEVVHIHSPASLERRPCYTSEHW